MPGTVTDLPAAEPDTEMQVFGGLVALPMVLLAIPVAPFLAAYWVVARLLGR